MYISKSLSVRNFFKSPLLMIASFSSVIACLGLLLCLIAPFWFDVKSKVTFPHGIPAETHTENMGMTGYVDYNGRWHNLNMIQKTWHGLHVPLAFKAAQVLYITSFIVASVASAGVTLLALKTYRHFVAEVAVTTAFFYSGNVLAIILSLACLGAEGYHIWPDRSYDIVSPQWAAYIAILATVTLGAALVIMVMETLMSCRTVESVRRKPKKLLEDEPLYYKFDYRKIPKVNVEPNPILRHVYENPAMHASTAQAYHMYAPHQTYTPSTYSMASYTTQPSLQPGMQPGYGPPPKAYGRAVAAHPTQEVGYDDSDMDKSSYSVSVDNHGRRLVSM